jgi:NAD(P)-dependent dehydrogenase (short-subunit alcohol dehydrogenase family)
MAERKVAIVTAGGRGMGGAIARALNARDYDLVLMSPGGSAEALAAELGGIGVNGSVTRPGDLERLVTAAMEAHGRIDAVANNTGFPPKGPLLDIPDEDWHAGADMVLLNVVRMARLVTPIMVTQRAGAIVNISTYAAVEPSPAYPVSAVFRAGLSAYTRLYADEYAASGIRMNNILPGFIDTHGANDDVAKTIPARRFGKPDEIGETAAFLLSDGAGYITGQNIRVDGGLSRSV